MIPDRKTEKTLPRCPFCNRYISRPVLTDTGFGEILCGKCECDAIFVCDLTGRCVGEAYMEALVLLKGDWDIGVMDPDKDYTYAEMDYEYRTHKKVVSRNIGESPGKLVFLKPGIAHEYSPATAEHEKNTIMKGKTTQKKRLKKLLQEGDLQGIVAMSSEDRGVINHLFSFSYDKGDVMTWRAIEAVGLISKEVSMEDPEFVRNTTRRLLWSMTEESGGVSWSAPEMLGEIIRSNPEEFGDLIPLVWSNRNEDVFKAGVIWAMGRIAEVAPAKIVFILQELSLMIKDIDPLIRGYSIWVLSKIGGTDKKKDIELFIDDESLINFYRNGILSQISIGEIAQESMNSIS